MLTILRGVRTRTALIAMVVAGGVVAGTSCSTNMSGLGGSGGAGGAASAGRSGTASGGSVGQAGAGGKPSASGGSSGTAGQAGAGGRTSTGSGGAGAGGATATAECETAADCRLDDGCCACEAAPVSAAPPPACAILCVQSRCAAQQLPQGAVACTAGRCVAGFNCDASHVTCKIAIVACDPGQVPGVNAAGDCYTGGCVPATQCKTVTSCAACDPSLACVTYQTQMGDQVHCVTIPDSCNGNTTCGCLGPTVCKDSYRALSDPAGPARGPV